MKYRQGVISGLAASLLLISGLSMPPARAAGIPPVYVHMNGLNDFLPTLVIVRPNQPVVFVNQDTGVHSIRGYNPINGRLLKDIYTPVIVGTPGAGHPVHTYTVRLSRPGIYYYICTIHAHLVSVYRPPHHAEPYRLPTKRAGVNGYGGSMAGVIVVTRNPALLKSNPPIVHQRILPDFWGNGDVQGSLLQ